jgi:hypothetical protein
MNRTTGSDCCSHSLVKLRKRSCRRTSDKSALRSHRRLRTHPDDIIYVHIISIKALIRRIKVQHSRKPRLINAPEIQEAAVLTELIIIAAVVCRSVNIAKEHSDAVRILSRHLLHESAATVYIYFS